MMKASEFVRRVIDVAQNYKTLYVMGCFGAPLTLANKNRYTHNHIYNKKKSRTEMINNASADTFGFDCVNLIKGILWGWCGDKTKSHGGAIYASNGVPDIGANAMITKCPDATNVGWNHMDPGEVVWTNGHIGVYIGNGLAVECSPAWKNRVQITAVSNIETKPDYAARRWKKHGHLPYLQYDTKPTPVKPKPSAVIPPTVKEVRAAGVANSFDRAVAGTYTVTASALNVRTAAGINHKVLTVIPRGTKVNCYGYYSVADTDKWLYVQFTRYRVTYTGFCSARYLRR